MRTDVLHDQSFSTMEKGDGRCRPLFAVPGAIHFLKEECTAVHADRCLPSIFRCPVLLTGSARNEMAASGLILAEEHRLRACLLAHLLRVCCQLETRVKPQAPCLGSSWSGHRLVCSTDAPAADSSLAPVKSDAAVQTIT
jgi:hypothetical protein